jgi:hypothetical protein
MATPNEKSRPDNGTLSQMKKGELPKNRAVLPVF